MQPIMCTFFLSTAGEVIKKWLKDVEATAPVEGTAVAPILSNYSYKPLPFSPQANKEDFLGSFDWSHGNVADNARTVVENLLRKDLSTGSYSAQASADHKQSHDPRVAMEMRHKKVSDDLLVVFYAISDVIGALINISGIRLKWTHCVLYILNVFEVFLNMECLFPMSD